MGVDVVGAVLGVVFDDEDRSVVPVGAVRDGLDDAAESEIVVGDGSRGTRNAGGGTVGVVVGEIEEDELRELSSLPFSAGANEIFEFVEELVGAELVGIHGVEVGIQRVEVVAKSRLRCWHALQ